MRLRSPSWRKANILWPDIKSELAAGTPLFHACDDVGLFLCEPTLGLLASVEPPNEGSQFCPTCMALAMGHPCVS